MKTYEILDLNSPDTKKNYFFYALCSHFCFLQPIGQENCVFSIKVNIFTMFTSKGTFAE